MIDFIGSSDMIQGQSTLFTTDRNGYSSNALALNGGYAYVPSGVFFNTAFTVALWIYPVNLGRFSRILDFGTGGGFGGGKDNIVFALTYFTNQRPYFYVNGVNYLASSTLTLNKWQHLVVTYDGSTIYMYKNGVSILNANANYTLTSINRSVCYIGKSNWNDSYSDSIIDDLRIYATVLSNSSIIALMNQSKVY